MDPNTNTALNPNTNTALNPNPNPNPNPNTPIITGGESSWIDWDRWSWWFKYAVIYTICVYAALILYQVVVKFSGSSSKKEKFTENERQRSVNEMDEKKDLGYFLNVNRITGFFSYLNEIRISILANVWDVSKESVSDFVARRSARIPTKM